MPRYARKQDFGTNRIFERGRSTLGWTRGEPITHLDQLKPGDLLITVSHQFRAENLVRVLENSSPMAYCEYVTPGTLRRSDHDEMAIWDFDLISPPTEEFFRAVRCASGALT